jgi:excisionase family DNA binding protein
MSTKQAIKPKTAQQGTAPLDRYLMTVPGAASRLGVSNKCIWNWVYSRKLPVVRLSGRCLRIPSDAIDQLISDSFVPARQEVQ